MTLATSSGSETRPSRLARGPDLTHREQVLLVRPLWPRHRCVRHARSDGVHVDPVRPQLAGGGAGEAEQAGLRAGVGDPAVGAERGAGADVDDLAAHSLLDHAARRIGDEQEGRGEVHGVDPVPAVPGEGQHAPLADDAGGVHQDVDPAVALDHGGDDLSHGVGVGEVGHDGRRVTSPVADGLDGSGRAIGIDVDHRDHCPEPGQRLGRGAPDARRRSGHDRDLRLEHRGRHGARVARLPLVASAECLS